MRLCSRSLTAQGKTDAGDDIIPVVFLTGGVIDQHAVNEALGEIATVVPNLIVLVAGYGKKPRRDSLVLNIARRVLFRKKRGGRVSFGVAHGLNRQVSSAITRYKPSSISVRSSGGFGKDRNGKIY